MINSQITFLARPGKWDCLGASGLIALSAALALATAERERAARRERDGPAEPTTGARDERAHRAPPTGTSRVSAVISAA